MANVSCLCFCDNSLVSLFRWRCCYFSDYKMLRVIGKLYAGREHRRCRRPPPQTPLHDVSFTFIAPDCSVPFNLFPLLVFAR